MEWLAIIRTEQFNLFIVHESIRTNRPTPGYNDNQSKRMEMPWSLLLMRPWDISIQHICQDYRHLLIPGPRVLAINQWEQERVILKQQMVIRLTNDIWHREQRTDGQWIKLLPEQQWNWTLLDTWNKSPLWFLGYNGTMGFLSKLTASAPGLPTICPEMSFETTESIKTIGKSPIEAFESHLEFSACCIKITIKIQLECPSSWSRATRYQDRHRLDRLIISSSIFD